ncbi:MAG: RNA-binding S4 domain-containing protein [Alphaproteobacteria bacterium]|nr:MAG: RNA-binding S4 domain-containing protein [Alphaproteobacteria bacterium]
MPVQDTPLEQRIDKWLWYVRLFKSRSLAAKFVETGKLRLSRGPRRDKLSKPSQTIIVGDILTFTLHERVRVIEVISTGQRRGPASEAQTLYKDLSPPPPPKDPQTNSKTPSRAPGEGRPTKKDRRALDRLKHSGEG